VAGRFLERAFPQSPVSMLTVFGSYWLGFMYYAFLLVVLIDIVRLLNHWFNVIPVSIMRSPQWVGVAAVWLFALIVTYGVWNARHPVIHHYDVDIAKHGGADRTLHVVLVADIHLGRIVNAGRLARLVERVNALHPDIVLFGGDTIDEDVGPFVEQQMPEIFLRLHPRLGCYAIFGNHEYLGGQAAEAQQSINEAGVIVLRDQTRLVDNSFYLVGRDDLSSMRTTHRQRATLATLLHGVDLTRPIIELDHQPFHLEEAEQAGVDLQLSGHTHRGQLFPNNYVTHAIFEDDFGYLRKGACQYIVTCGYGTWGPPLRTGNRPEIVDITLHFTKQ
jgi:predicted MPP superfamily phosphohydrolase